MLRRIPEFAFMRRSPGGILLGFVLLFWSKPAQAFDWDTHYSFNYYLARACGYTPEQARRIASACVRVDYCTPTEPFQGFLPSAHAHAARVHFHAFEDESQEKPTPQDAQAGIERQRDLLWQQALESGNPGLFLHFLQDMTSHAGFGSTWGHGKQGHRPDFLSFGETSRSAGMTLDSLKYLRSFMATIKPQIPRFYTSVEVDAVLAALRNVNPVPARLNLTAAPDVEQANKVIQKALVEWKEMHPFVSKPYAYAYDADGNVLAVQRDLWTLSGDLEVTFSARLSETTDAFAGATITIAAAATREGDPEYPLDARHTVNSLDDKIVFADIPVGEVVLSLRTKAGAVTHHKFFLNRRHGRCVLALGDQSPAAISHIVQIPLPASECELTGLNAWEQVSGWEGKDDSQRKGFFWDAQTGMHELPLAKPMGHSVYAASSAEGINAAGQITGWVTTITGNAHPALWSPDASGVLQMKDFFAATTGVLDLFYGKFLCVSDSGTGAGWSSTTSPGKRGIGVGMRYGYDKTMLTPLSQLLSVNDNDNAAGWQAGKDDAKLSCILMGEEITLLDMTASGQALGINNRNEAAGFVLDAAQNERACIWIPQGQNYSRQEIGVRGRATAINDAGVVVGCGAFPSGDKRAFLWSRQDSPRPDPDEFRAAKRPAAPDKRNLAGGREQGGAMPIDLNTLLPANTGWILEEARAINNTGAIMGIGQLNGVRCGFLLFLAI